jgi:hypothetical protein
MLTLYTHICKILPSFFIFFILYHDQQMNNWLTNYHTTPTRLDTTVSFSGS